MADPIVQRLFVVADEVIDLAAQIAAVQAPALSGAFLRARPLEPVRLGLPGKPAGRLRGLLCRAFQAFARGLDLRIGRAVTSRPHFRCRS